ncbi:Transmembrane protein, partial [Parasponia andersonii]
PLFTFLLCLSISDRSAMEASPPPTLNLKVIFNETNRILKAQHRHFLSLSFLFLFPASVAIGIYPLLQSFFSDVFVEILFGHATYDHNQLAKTLLLALAFLIFTTVFSLSAVGSLTYSVLHSFHGQPLNLKSAIKSIPTSFFRLLGTNLLVQTVFLFITFVFVTVFATLIAIARMMGLHIEFSSPYFRMLCLAMVIALFWVLIYVQVNWALSSAVVVVETTWGLASLKRSTSLVKGRKGLVFLVSLAFGFQTTVMGCVIGFTSLSMGLDSTSGEDWKWLIVLLATQVLMFSTTRTLILLFEMVATTVLYMYCNEAVVDHRHGIKNFSVEYVTLALDDDDDEKAPPVVSKLHSYNEV